MQVACMHAHAMVYTNFKKYVVAAESNKPKAKQHLKNRKSLQLQNDY